MNSDWRERQVKPDCATDAEWNDWLDSEALYARGRKVSFCHDCTPGFKAESMRLGLCSFPGVKFKWHNDKVSGREQYGSKPPDE